ncbi:MAG: hypothetical protein CME31_01135 [Gimesia sp.]|uniref:Leucine Rich repeats (2 copies) n=1 Tax=Gimesia maris TaxID=122 RepID=A0A3D3R5S6_9PLAN|nr:hypothetical protein [Gimesia sp.]HCO23936.1 hypothetical protein [Gimesia maris]
MKQKLILATVLCSGILISAGTILWNSNSGQRSGENSQSHSNSKQQKSGNPIFPGLRADFDKTGEILRITGKETKQGQSIIQTSRTSREVFEWILKQNPRKLHFEIVYLNDADMALLEQLSELEEITLKNTNAGDQTVSHLLKIKSLKRLSIQNGNITDQSVFLFSQMTGLDSLSLKENRFLPWKSYQILKDLLPDTKIEKFI